MSAKNNPTIQEKTKQLDELVTWFNSDEFELEKALDVFAKAEKLAADIEHDLAQLKNNINIVKAKFNEVE